MRSTINKFNWLCAQLRYHFFHTMASHTTSEIVSENHQEHEEETSRSIDQGMDLSNITRRSGIGKVCKCCNAMNPIRKKKCFQCKVEFEQINKKRLKLNKKPNATIQKRIIQDRINELCRLCNLNFVILMTKKHGNGITVESMCTNGFGKEFIGADPKNRPESGRLVMDMAKTYFQDWCRKHPEEGGGGEDERNQTAMEQTTEEPDNIAENACGTREDVTTNSDILNMEVFNDCQPDPDGRNTGTLETVPDFTGSLPEVQEHSMFEGFTIMDSTTATENSVLEMRAKNTPAPSNMEESPQRKQKIKGVKAKKGSIVPVCTIGEQERFWLFLVKRQLGKNSYSGTWLNLVEGNKYILGSEDRIEHQSIITRNEKPYFLSSKIKKERAYSR